MCVGYFINQEYYAEVLCENKEKEDSCCEGKCAMEKELVSLTEKEESQSTKTPDSAIKISKVEEAIVTTLKFYPPNSFSKVLKITFEAKLKQGELTVLFKPPTI